MDHNVLKCSLSINYLLFLYFWNMWTMLLVLNKANNTESSLFPEDWAPVCFKGLSGFFGGCRFGPSKVQRHLWACHRGQSRDMASVLVSELVRLTKQLLEGKGPPYITSPHKRDGCAGGTLGGSNSTWLPLLVPGRQWPTLSIPPAPPKHSLGYSF